MKINYTKDELIQLLETTGIEVYWNERPKINEEHIIIEFIGSDNINADNITHFQTFQMQITFATRLPQNKLKINKFMKENFNSSLSTDFFEDKEWYVDIYEVYLFIKDYL